MTQKIYAALLTGLLFTSVTQSVLANEEALQETCEARAVEQGIAPDQLDDFVAACMAELAESSK